MISDKNGCKNNKSDIENDRNGESGYKWQELFIDLEMYLYRTVVRTVAMRGSETWTLRKVKQDC